MPNDVFLLRQRFPLPITKIELGHQIHHQTDHPESGKALQRQHHDNRGAMSDVGPTPSSVAVLHDISHAANGVEQRSIKRHITGRRRRIATSTTLVSLSKFMSHTCSAIPVPDRHSPFLLETASGQEFLGSQLQALTTPVLRAVRGAQFQVRQTQSRGLCGIPRAMGPP